MNLLSVCPLRVASLDWQTSRGIPVLTVIAKATYHLSPVTCSLATEQEAPNEHEIHWNDDAERSLRAPSDLVPYKPRPEVTLVGQAFAPRGEPVARLVARLIVGRVDKSIAVQARPNDRIEPVGFGPIAASSPARQARLGRHAGSWSAGMLRGGALPEGIDPLYFLSAPPDQLLDELRADERIVLENLHPDHPRLVTSLPGYEPRALVERPHGPAAELGMVCDTLWIDTDRSLCTLTWRGQLTLDRSGQEGRVVVAMEMIGRPLDRSTVEELAGQPSSPTVGTPDALAASKNAAATPKPLSATPRWPGWLGLGEGEPVLLPGGVRVTDLPADGLVTVDVPLSRNAVEAAVARAEAARAEVARVKLSVPALPLAPPVSATASAVEPSSSPWLRTAQPPLPSSAPVTPWGGSAPVAPLAILSEPPQPARVPSATALHRATEHGAAAASNAAAASAGETARPAARPDSARPAAPVREPAREHVDLLWFDAAALPRIRADRVLSEGRPERPAPRWIKDGASPREPQEAKDRREILAIIGRVKPVDDPLAIDPIARAAYQDDGTFTAPLVLVAGELSFEFDEVETLRAMLTVTAPFLGADKKLRDVAGGAVEALKIEGRLPSDIAAGFNRRIEEAFTQGQRSVASGYLDTSVERILLEDRRYPKKTLFGEPRLRALLTFPGGSAPIPTYLPEALATRLPLFRRFKARAIVELRPQEDQYETHTDALLVLALGRVLRRSG